jgi:hypothetical protein
MIEVEWMQLKKMPKVEAVEDLKIFFQCLVVVVEDKKEDRQKLKQN